MPKPGPFPAGVEPPRSAPVWRVVANLRPKHVDVVPQYVVQLGDGSWGMTQGRDNAGLGNTGDDLILSRFDKAGRLLETREVSRGGHGDHTDVLDGKLTTRIRGVWASVDFGSPWSWRGRAYATPLCPVRPRTSTSLQGEIYIGGKRWLRLYGQSQKGGAERDPSHTFPLLEVIEGDRTARVYDLRRLPLDSKGLPIGGRYEPEGISVGVLDGVRVALVGFAIGRLGSTTMRVWACPLDSL